MNLTEISVLANNALGFLDHLKLPCSCVHILKLTAVQENFLHVQIQPTLLLIGKYKEPIDTSCETRQGPACNILEMTI